MRRSGIIVFEVTRPKLQMRGRLINDNATSAAQAKTLSLMSATEASRALSLDGG
jgi:hypothetical protein